MLTSARNHLSGTVARIKTGAVNDEVELALPGGETIVAIITHESVAHLGLKVGREAIALIKASSVLVAIDTGPRLKLSARNRLDGIIAHIAAGAVNSEVVIDLQAGVSLVAIVTNGAVEKLGLREGKSASAIFKASSVILGVAG